MLWNKKSVGTKNNFMKMEDYNNAILWNMRMTFTSFLAYRSISRKTNRY